MARNVNNASSRTRPVRAAALIAVFMGMSVVGACSRVPDALNPAEWYRDTVDLFAGEDKADEKKGAGKETGLAADRGKSPPGSDKPFPNLASVDRQARARDNIKGGLTADPERPKYASAPSRQGEAVQALGPRPAQPPVAVAAAPPAGATQPPPSAVPTTPVAPAPVAPSAATPSAMPALPPPVTTAEQKAQETRLARQLAEIRAEAATPTKRSARVGLPPVSGESPTIIISSLGIETAELGAAGAPLPPAPALSPAPGGIAALGSSGLPIPANAAKVATILFDNGSATLKARDKRILGGVMRLQRQNGGTIRVVGHASSRTRNLNPIRRKMANFQVSIDRADGIARELMRIGVKREDIQVAAVSDAEPVYYEFMPSGEAGNRRAEVYLGN